MRTARDLRSVLHEALYALDSGSQLKNLLFLLVRTTNIPPTKSKFANLPKQQTELLDFRMSETGVYF